MALRPGEEVSDFDDDEAYDYDSVRDPRRDKASPPCLARWGEALASPGGPNGAKRGQTPRSKFYRQFVIIMMFLVNFVLFSMFFAYWPCIFYPLLSLFPHVRCLLRPPREQTP